VNQHALEVLEFQRVLEGIADGALSPLGRQRVMALLPRSDPTGAQAELHRVQETADFLDRFRDWSPPEIPDARRALHRLTLEGSVLEPKELFSLGVLLTSSRGLREGLLKAGEDLPALRELREGYHVDRGLEKTIQRTVDREGEVLDTGSPELGRIRSRIRRAEGRIVQALEKLMGSLPDRIAVSDASVTLREGRYVIPIRREGRGEVGGIVVDESATGATLFVEPPVATELMAELRGLVREEAREILRILRDRTEELRPGHLLLEASQEALVEFDSLYARARAALAWSGHAPTLLPPGGQELEIVQGRHPLLLARKDRVVPFDLRLDPGERALVVSGPNTGGKSVFLKAVGLLGALAQSGVIPPVGEGTRLPVFTRFFADIGDEQSIVESLSTFSAHLGNLKEIVTEADAESLVLIDEMGTGTDPQEGAALARTILEALVRRGTLAIVTSHLGALKRLDTAGSGVVNASLQFDPDRIEPTYHLLKGRPGRSYGLAIARRLGFPPDLLDRAEEHVPTDEARMEELLGDLERKEKEARDLLTSLQKDQAQARDLQAELETREQDLRARERTARTRAQEEARKLLMEARREVEEAIQELREVGTEPAGEEPAMEEAQRRARKRVEDAAGRFRGKTEGVGGKSPAREFRPGDRVGFGGTGSKGRVVEVRDGRAVVETSGVRLQLSAQDLVFLGPAEEERSATPNPDSVAASWQGPEPQPETEIDLRGFRVSEVDGVVDRALDQAVLGGLGEIRIIHGKGTGALRTNVQELLTGDPRVSGFRLGGPGEGGAGVTIVSLR